MYAIITPLLYREPIVQNLGLFIQGIEKPLPDAMTFDHDPYICPVEVLPLHKLHALALVRKLHLVHASSSKLVTPLLCTNNKAYEFPTGDTCDVDSLARADLDGWRDAITITKRARNTHGESFLIFQHVEHLTLGAWDDGRWATYIANISGNPGAHDLQADKDIKTVIHQLGSCLDILRSKHVCRRLTKGPYSNVPPNIGVSSEARPALGISVVHAKSLRDIRLYDSYPGPVRVYADIGLFEVHETNLVNRRETEEPFKSYDWILYPINAIRANVAKGTVVEICMVPKNSWRKVGRTEKQMQLDLALRIKAALEKFHEEVVERKGKDRLWGGDVRILVGDQVPVCPCCGAT
jgi:hypothetical protein